MILTPTSDLAPGAWIAEAGRREPWRRLVALGPSGYEAHARLLFLPDPSAPDQDEADAGADDEDPRHAEPDALWVVTDVLARFTTTSDDVHVALWDGWGDDFVKPRLHVPNRAFYLFRGPLASLRGWPHEPPAMIWPEDRAWFVASDVDPHYAGIAASRAAVDALLAEPLVDVVGADLDVEPPAYR